MSYLHYCGAVVCDCLLPIFVYHEKIAAIRSKCAFDCRLYGETGVDIGQDLPSALRLVRTYKS